MQKSNPNLSSSILDCLLIQLHADRYTSSAAVRSELRDSLMCLKRNASCSVSCTELPKIRHTMKTTLQMNTASHPEQTDSALSDAVVILTSCLFHRGLLLSYVHMHVHAHKERADRVWFLFHRTIGWWFSNTAAYCIHMYVYMHTKRERTERGFSSTGQLVGGLVIKRT